MDPGYEFRLKNRTGLVGTPTRSPVQTSRGRTPVRELGSSCVRRLNPFFSPPGSTPMRLGLTRCGDTRTVTGDRYIPSRSSSNLDLFGVRQSTKKSDGDEAEQTPSNKENDAQEIYELIIENEMMHTTPIRKRPISDRSPQGSPRLFQYQSSPVFATPTARKGVHSASPLSPVSHQLLQTPLKAPQKIPDKPFKVLDAPELQDDFYLNLLDWSSTNILAVGLARTVYLYNASTAQVSRLCDLQTGPGDSVTSVGWSEDGKTLAIGAKGGVIQLWDVEGHRCTRSLHGHLNRVGSLAWYGSDGLSSGSRDYSIWHRDLRASGITRQWQAHSQEVCGMKWSPDCNYLASGGNDNKLMIWSMSSTQPVQRFSDHVAAVKAISWSPHQHGLLASGGGTADRTIRFVNVLTSQPLQVVNAGSQVCNLAWSKNASKLVSTHGYSENHVAVWRYPRMTRPIKLKGHEYRVLYMAMSPDGESIVTGAGDETLRFWKVFGKQSSQSDKPSQLTSMSFR